MKPASTVVGVDDQTFPRHRNGISSARVRFPARVRRLATTIAMVTSGYIAAPAMAADGDSLELDEIVVTARKRAEDLQDVPVAVTAIAGDQLDRLVLRDIREIEGYTPNVVIDSVSVAPAGASLYFRGVGTQEVEKSFDPAVGVVVDGVALSFVNGSMANTFDLASMEVLRGPQGTLFGRNTTGGVVNLTHSRPTGEFGVKYQLTAGTDDRVDVDAVLNFPIAKDVLAGKLAFASQKDGGQLENEFLGEQVGDADNKDYSGTLLWTPAESFDALFIYENYEDTNDGVPLVSRNSLNTGNPVNPQPDFSCVLQFIPIGSFPNACDDPQPDTTRQDFYDSINFELDAYTLQMNWDVGIGTITSVSGYRETDENVPTDFDGTQYGILHVVRDQQSEQTSTELRFASSDSLSESFDFVAGVYYLDDNYQLEQNTAILGVLSVIGANQFAQTHTDHERETYSGFGEANFHLSDAWTLIAGARWTTEEKDIYSDSFAAVGAPPLAPISNVTTDESWDETTYKAGIDYRLSDDVLLYAIYSEGFRSGGFNARNSSPADIGPYDPEYVDQYEAGMKSEFMDNRLRMNLAVFYSDYTDKQEEVILNDPILGSLTVVKNAADVVLSGAEAELSWAASEALLVNANLGYLDAEYDQYDADLNGDGIVTDNTHLELRRTPEFTGGVNATYSMRIGCGTASAYAAYRYTDEYWVDASNDPRGLLDSRGVVDVTLSYEWELSEGRSVTFSAFGRDVTDEQDYNSLVSIPGLLAFSAVGGGEQYGLKIMGNY